VLSIDAAQAPTLVIAPDLGRAGLSHGGAVQLYTANAAPYLNGRHNPRATTSTLAAAAGPRYLSINNAFGRPWIANAPLGERGAGNVSVVDPNGAPLANPPSASAGGVFAGALTSRKTVPQAERNGLLATWFNHRASAQLTPGALAAGALGTAFMGPSPDGSGLAVFAVATADGAVSQVHVQDGVDGLSAAGTVGVDANDSSVIGMAFKWNPLRALYLADAARHRVVLLHLGDDRRHFTVARREALESPLFNQPVDLVPAVPEIANPRFASHTTLAGDSDLYVANRGDGTLLRIDQQGRVLARAVIDLPQGERLGAARIRAIAVSADAQRLWLTLQGPAPGHPNAEGALIEVSAFDAAGPFAASMRANVAPPSELTTQHGAQLFSRNFTASEGLGPRFNARSCVTCHSMPTVGGMSHTDEHFVRRVARMDAITGRVLPLSAPDGAVAHRHALSAAAAMPRAANVVSLRMPPALYPIARIDDIDDAAIEAQAVAKGDGIKGRVHRVTGPDGEQRIGRYGWKADIGTLEQMVADAFANELGIHSALARKSQEPPEDDGTLVRAVAAFVRSLVPPRSAK
jgi:hypothetical protein